MNKQELIDDITKNLEVYNEILNSKKQQLKSYTTIPEIIDTALDIRQFETIVDIYKNFLSKLERLNEGRKSMTNYITVNISDCDKCPYESNIYTLLTGETTYRCDKNEKDEWTYSHRNIPDHCPILQKMINHDSQNTNY